MVEDVESSENAIPLFVFNGLLLKLFECYGCLMFIYTLGFVSKPTSGKVDVDNETKSSSFFTSFRNLFISTSISRMEREYYAAINSSSNNLNDNDLPSSFHQNPTTSSNSSSSNSNFQSTAPSSMSSFRLRSENNQSSMINDEENNENSSFNSMWEGSKKKKKKEVEMGNFEI